MAVFRRSLALVIVALAVACTGTGTTTARRAVDVRPPPPEQRLSTNVYSLRSGSDASTRTLSFLIRRASELSLAAGFSHFAVAQFGREGTGLRLDIFMYNEEREIPLELINAELFDANEYREKPYVPLGLYPGAS